MRLIPLISSHLSLIGYNPDRERLGVVFRNDRAYLYEGVPPGVFIAVITDPDSQGQAFNRLVKTRAFPYREVTLEELERA